LSRAHLDKEKVKRLAQLFESMPNSCIDCEVGNELADFRFRHYFGMLLIVKENKASDPTNIGALGA
jgi:hypothetical protein